MRLIDADALLSGFDVRKVVEYDEGGWGVDYNAVPVGAIEAAPTIDAVAVVRCKDCTHYNHAVIDDDPAETFEVDVYLHKDLFPTRVTPDFYCAHGKRKMNVEVQDVPQD